MTTFDEKLSKHIDKVIAIQNSEKEKMLSLEELKEVDMSLGVTEEEWTQMMEKADSELALANNHFYYKNYTEAYNTAESAVFINPHLTQALVLMADSALKIYETEDNDEYFNKAEQHAKEVLKRAPAENRAIEIIATLNKYRFSEKAKKKTYLRYGIIATGVLIILLSLIFLFPKNEKAKDQSVKYELIEAEEDVNEKWAQVENVIARRNQIIPQLFLLVNQESPQTDGLKNEIEELQTKISEASKENQIPLQAQLQEKYQALTTLISSQNNSENIKTVLIQIEGSYNRISVEGKRYNEAVKNYNVLLKKRGSEFPEFQIKPYFKGN